MDPLAFLAAFVVAPLATVVVYVDSVRRGLARRRRRRWTFVVGTISFCGFLLPSLFEQTTFRAYLLLRGLLGGPSDPVFLSPLEFTVFFSTLGLAISTASVLLYGSIVTLTERDSPMGATTRNQ